MAAAAAAPATKGSQKAAKLRALKPPAIVAGFKHPPTGTIRDRGHRLQAPGIAIAAVVLASFAALGAMALLIPADTVREAVKAEIRNVTGLDPVLRGDVAVSLFPTGSVSFADVTLGDDGQAGAGGRPADRAAALLPAVRRPHRDRRRVAGAPAHHRRLRRDGRSNWAGLVDTLARALGPKANRPVNASSFTEIRITDGTIAIDDAARGIAETLKDVELSLAWPSISKSFGATGHFVWHDEPVEQRDHADRFRSPRWPATAPA